MTQGIEQLLAMAAVDPEFAAALRRDREAAVQASGVTISTTERGILGAIDDQTLQQMTANMAGLLSEQDRRAFLGRSAAALVALFGGAAAASGCQCPVVRGTRPDPTQQAQPEPTTLPPDQGQAARPIGGLTTGQPVHRKEVAPTGIRPDRPELPRPDAGPKRDPYRLGNEDRRTRGIRPDRPRRRSRE